MQRSKTLRLIGAAAAVALFATACSGDGGGEGGDTGDTTETEAEGGEDTEGGETEDGGSAGGTVSTYIGEPESLVAINSNESEGNAVLDALYTGLIDYDPETSEPRNAVASSIESPDEGKTWNITLNEGWTFHDGTPVTANSFVDAWNYAAYGPNAQQTSGFFADIEGYEDLQCGTREATAEDVEAGNAEAEGDPIADCDNAAPSSEAMSGIEVVSDTEFTVTLAEPQSFWSTRLGYAAYSPLPEAFFEDPEGFNEEPIGNGPFMMDGPWEHDVAIKTVAYPDYQGEDKAQIDALEFRIYADVNTAVTDLYAGELDIVDAIPPERWSEAQNQVPNTETSPSSSINYIGFPTYLAPFDNPDMRAALSMAIDRQAITETIFEGTRQPAYNLLAPVIPAYEEEVCPAWTYNPEEAVSRFEAAGGTEALGDSLEIWFNEGGGHETWMQAVVNQWAQTLGIDANSVAFQQLQFAEYLGLADNQEFTGPFRLGWGMDYPHPQNYMQLLLQSDFLPPVGANNTGYQSEEYDAALAEALAVPDIEEAAPLYQEAMKIACEDAPLAPMFYGLNQFGWNDTVSNVFVDAFGQLDYARLTAN